MANNDDNTETDDDFLNFFEQATAVDTVHEEEIVLPEKASLSSVEHIAAVLDAKRNTDVTDVQNIDPILSVLTRKLYRGNAQLLDDFNNNDISPKEFAGMLFVTDVASQYHIHLPSMKSSTAAEYVAKMCTAFSEQLASLFSIDLPDVGAFPEATFEEKTTIETDARADNDGIVNNITTYPSHEALVAASVVHALLGETISPALLSSLTTIKERAFLKVSYDLLEGKDAQDVAEALEGKTDDLSASVLNAVISVARRNGFTWDGTTEEAASQYKKRMMSRRPFVEYLSRTLYGFAPFDYVSILNTINSELAKNNVIMQKPSPEPRTRAEYVHFRDTLLEGRRTLLKSITFSVDAKALTNLEERLAANEKERAAALEKAEIDYSRFTAQVYNTVVDQLRLTQGNAHYRTTAERWEEYKKKDLLNELTVAVAKRMVDPQKKDMREAREGDEVVVAKTYYPNGQYRFREGTVNRVPIGSKGKVVRKDVREDALLVLFKKLPQGDEKNWWVHYSEVEFIAGDADSYRKYLDELVGNKKQKEDPENPKEASFIQAARTLLTREKKKPYSEIVQQLIEQVEAELMPAYQEEARSFVSNKYDPERQYIYNGIFKLYFSQNKTIRTVAALGKDGKQYKAGETTQTIPLGTIGSVDRYLGDGKFRVSWNGGGATHLYLSELEPLSLVQFAADKLADGTPISAYVTKVVEKAQRSVETRYKKKKKLIVSGVTTLQAMGVSDAAIHIIFKDKLNEMIDQELYELIPGDDVLQELNVALDEIDENDNLDEKIALIKENGLYLNRYEYKDTDFKTKEALREVLVYFGYKKEKDLTLHYTPGEKVKLLIPYDGYPAGAKGTFERICPEGTGGCCYVRLDGKQEQIHINDKNKVLVHGDIPDPYVFPTFPNEAFTKGARVKIRLDSQDAAESQAEGTIITDRYKENMRVHFDNGVKNDYKKQDLELIALAPGKELTGEALKQFTEAREQLDARRAEIDRFLNPIYVKIESLTNDKRKKALSLATILRDDLYSLGMDNAEIEDTFEQHFSNIDILHDAHFFNKK